MNEHCDWARARLARLLDAELPSGEQATVDEHCAACADCRAYRDAMRSADRAARAALGAEQADGEAFERRWSEFQRRFDLVAAEELRARELRAEAGAPAPMSGAQVAAAPLEPGVIAPRSNADPQASWVRRLLAGAAGWFAPRPVWRWASLAGGAVAVAVVTTVLIARNPQVERPSAEAERLPLDALRPAPAAQVESDTKQAQVPVHVPAEVPRGELDRSLAAAPSAAPLAVQEGPGAAAPAVAPHVEGGRTPAAVPAPALDVEGGRTPAAAPAPALDVVQEFVPATNEAEQLQVPAPATSGVVSKDPAAPEPAAAFTSAEAATAAEESQGQKVHEAAEPIPGERLETGAAQAPSPAPVRLRERRDAPRDESTPRRDVRARTPSVALAEAETPAGPTDAEVGRRLAEVARELGIEGPKDIGGARPAEVADLLGELEGVLAIQAGLASGAATRTRETAREERGAAAEVAANLTTLSKGLRTDARATKGGKPKADRERETATPADRHVAEDVSLWVLAGDGWYMLWQRLRPSGDEHSAPRSAVGSAAGPDSLAVHALAAYERALAIEPADGMEAPALPPHVAARIAELRAHGSRRVPTPVTSPAQRRP